MKIKLSWVNRNVDEDGTRIFRAEAAFTSTTDMTPLATLAPGVQTYEDDTAVQNTLYYYRTEVFKGIDKILGNQIAITAMPYSGPGAQTLIAGDYERGFFGEVPAAELLTGDELAFRMNLTSGAITNTGTNWLKFAYKGKILFIPKLPIRYNLTWRALYMAGLVFGTDDFGPATLPTGIITEVNRTNQLKTVEVVGDRFIVRLIKGSPVYPANPTYNNSLGTYSDTTNLMGSEWNDLIYSITNSVPVSQSWGNFANYPDHDILGGVSPTMTTLCQESQPGGYVTTRGVAAYPTAVLGYPGASLAVGPDATSISSSLGGSTVNRTTAWRPVLEYLPE